MLYVFSKMIPDYNTLDSYMYVIDGYEIPNVVIVQQMLTVLGFLVVLISTGYFVLKTREIAA